YNHSGNHAKALAYAEKALQLDPKSDPAWFQKAKALEAQGRLQDAIDCLNKATELNPHSSTYFYVLANYYRRGGKTEESRKALESFNRLDKENSELEKMRREARSARVKTPAAQHE